MEPNTNEATAPKRLKKGGRRPLIIVGVIVGILVAAYLVCCYLGTYSDTFAPRYTINGVSVGGLTVEQASEKIWEEYQQRTVSVYLSTEEDPIDFVNGRDTASDLEKQGLEPVMEIPISQLGVTLSEDYEGGVRGSFLISHGRAFSSTAITISAACCWGAAPSARERKMTGYSFRRQRTPQQRSCPWRPLTPPMSWGMTH